jgi:hypothetical protein
MRIPSPLSSVVLMAALSLPALAAAGVSGVKTVVIFAVDGLGANVLRSGMPPIFRSFQREGAFSLKGRGVMPTLTFPNFASMLSGAGPEQHGVTSNEWRPDHFDVSPSCQGAGNAFPTIFGVLRRQRPHSRLAMFFDGDGFPFIVEPGVPDKTGAGAGPDATLAMALDYITASRPTLVFLHVDLMDHAGHTEGFESPAYAKALVHCDELLAALMKRLADTGMLSSTIVLITSDHGGVGKKHGGTSMTELEIPWLIRGPGVIAGKEIQSPLNTFDTASTIAYIFGLQQPSCWISKPVVEAFTSTRAKPAGR